MTRVTAQDVARRAGVSRATVSYVLNDHPTQTIPVVTRDKVLRAAAELEYTPLASARNLRRGRSDVVVMLIPDWPLGPVIPAMMESIAQGLAPHGLELFLHRCLKDRPVKKLWRAITPAAVIRTGSLGPEEDEGLRRSQLGFLLELGMAENEDGLVLFPGTAAGRLQAEHLVVRGHERLGFAWPDDPRLEGFAKSRLKGVQLTCRRHGLQPPVVERLSLRRPPGEAVDRWRSQGVTGVCAFNDYLAFAVARAAREQGLGVPQEMAVVGMGNAEWGMFSDPPLTTVAPNPDKIGAAICERLLHGLGLGPPAASPRKTGFLDLIVRNSS